jgi:hypothetical protein
MMNNSTSPTTMNEFKPTRPQFHLCVQRSLPQSSRKRWHKIGAAWIKEQGGIRIILDDCPNSVLAYPTDGACMLFWHGDGPRWRPTSSLYIDGKERDGRSVMLGVAYNAPKGIYVLFNHGSAWSVFLEAGGGYIFPLTRRTRRAKRKGSGPQGGQF